jgi:hypothetical protein
LRVVTLLKAQSILLSSEFGAIPTVALGATLWRALGAADAGENDPEIEALKAKVAAVVVAAQNTGALDETALAQLPAGLADQLRAAWAAAGSAAGAETPGG